MESISAIAPAAAVPESQAIGSVQNTAKKQMMPIAAGVSATIARESALLSQLKPLEPLERLLDPRLQLLAPITLSGIPDPAPLLQQQLAVLPIGLEVDRSRDLVSDQHRQREIAETPLFPRDVSFKAVLIVEDQMRALAF